MKVEIEVANLCALYLDAKDVKESRSQCECCAIVKQRDELIGIVRNLEEKVRETADCNAAMKKRLEDWQRREDALNACERKATAFRDYLNVRAQELEGLYALLKKRPTAAKFLAATKAARARMDAAWAKFDAIQKEVDA